MKPLDVAGIPAGQVYQPTLLPMWRGKTTSVFQMVQAGHIPVFVDSEGSLDPDLIRMVLPEWKDSLPQVQVAGQARS